MKAYKKLLMVGALVLSTIAIPVAHAEEVSIKEAVTVDVMSAEELYENPFSYTKDSYLDGMNMIASEILQIEIEVEEPQVLNDDLQEIVIKAEQLSDIHLIFDQDGTVYGISSSAKVENITEEDDVTDIEKLGSSMMVLYMADVCAEQNNDTEKFKEAFSAELNIIGVMLNNLSNIIEAEGTSSFIQECTYGKYYIECDIDNAESTAELLIALLPL